MAVNSSRGGSLNVKMQMIDLAGRVNFIDMKNNKIEKSMIECINFLRQAKFSEEKSTKSSINKTSASSKTNQQFRMTKRNYLKRQDIEKDRQLNQSVLQNKLVLWSQRNQQGVNKVQKTLRGFVQRTIRTQPYPESDNLTNPLIIEQSNFQINHIAQSPKASISTRKLNRTINNFFQTNSQNLSTLQKISMKQKQQRLKKKRQEQLKLMLMKKRLLEEEERSIKEFENCVMYKQRIVDKVKNEDRMRQILSGNVVWKVKRQN